MAGTLERRSVHCMAAETVSAMNLRIDRDKQIWNGNNCIGNIDDDDFVWLYVGGHAVKIGRCDHPSEAVKMVMERLTGE